MTAANDDYDYIIRIIQFLDRQFAIRFFVSSKDFDVLYRWWEKRIPFTVVSAALSRVVERRLLRNKPVASFSVFSRDVRLDYQSFLSLNIGRERTEKQGERNEIETFLNNFPEALDFLKADFALLDAERLKNNTVDAGPVHEKLLRHFLKNLALDLRRPEIEKKYRLNYLLHKFSIPSFD
jgi:hypothetical protein